MKTTFKMKEATNKEEAIASILDVLKESPLWLNKCTGNMAIIIQNCSESLQPIILESAPKDLIMDLFIEFKSEYYEFQDNTRWNY